MNGAHLHLVLNHFPLVGMFFSIIVLAVSFRIKNDSIKRLGLFLVVLTGVFTVASFLTGEPAEEVVEHLAGISKDLIHDHEEAAEKAAWIIWVTSVLSLVGLIFEIKKKKILPWIVPVVFVLSIVSVVTMSWSNNLGGKINHQEIRAK